MQNITIHLEKSRILAFILFTTHFLAIICSIYAFKNHVYITFIAILCLSSLKYCLVHYAWLNHKHSIVEINYVKENIWILKFNEEKTTTATVENDSLVTKNFILLNFCCSKENNHKARYSIPIFSDTADKDELRRLRCFLLI